MGPGNPPYTISTRCRGICLCAPGQLRLRPHSIPRDNGRSVAHHPPASLPTVAYLHSFHPPSCKRVLIKTSIAPSALHWAYGGPSIRYTLDQVMQSGCARPPYRGQEHHCCWIHLKQGVSQMVQLNAGFERAVEGWKRAPPTDRQPGSCRQFFGRSQ